MVLLLTVMFFFNGFTLAILDIFHYIQTANVTKKLFNATKIIIMYFVQSTKNN